MISDQELTEIVERAKKVSDWRKEVQKAGPKPSPKGFSFHLLTISFWEGDAGIAIAEIETWGWNGALFAIWLGPFDGSPAFDLFYLSYIKKRFFDNA